MYGTSPASCGCKLGSCGGSGFSNSIVPLALSSLPPVYGPKICTLGGIEYFVRNASNCVRFVCGLKFTTSKYSLVLNRTLVGKLKSTPPRNRHVFVRPSAKE